MLRKLLKNKVLLIVVIAAAVIILSVVIGVLISHNSGKNGKTGTDQETENNQEQDGAYAGDGLEVEGVTDTVDSIDGSGSWEDSEEQQGQSDNSAPKEKDHAETENSSPVEDPKQSEDDILEDDKTWGEIS